MDAAVQAVGTWVARRTREARADAELRRRMSAHLQEEVARLDAEATELFSYADALDGAWRARDLEKLNSFVGDERTLVSALDELKRRPQ